MSGGAALNRNGSLTLTRVSFEGNRAMVRICTVVLVYVNRTHVIQSNDVSS
jgi:hypothetical protein